MRKNLLFCLILAAVLLLPGCIIQKANGGGWLLVDGRKVHFAFNVRCDDGGTPGDPSDDRARGQLEVMDNNAPGYGRVKFHGEVNNFGELPCGAPIDGVGGFIGTYTPQPKTLGDGGFFIVAFTDQGEPGPSNGDAIALLAIGGVYDGYTFEGTIGGGNIQILK
jgi:hypothetical protein